MTEPLPIDPKRHAVFLDFDGTLAELIDDPNAVGLPRGTFEPLQRLQAALGGAFCIVSGRKIADLDRFLDPLAFAAAGVHGLERRMAPDGSVERLLTEGALDPVRDALAPLIEANQRLKLEDKGLALVLHYRTAPDLGQAANDAMDRACAGRDDLSVMHGDMIVEVHPAGMDKGKAVLSMMEREPFAGRIPVYAGDDTTDEFALKVVREAGGVSVKVGSKDSVGEYRLPNVAAVHRWIASSLAHSGMAPKS